MNTAKERLIIALDVTTQEKALQLVHMLRPYAGMFKIGMQLFYNEGPKVIKAVQDLGVKVFLDLKLHDIPNTVAGAARALTGLGVSIINVHAAGGTAMMKAASAAAAEEAEALGVKRPKVIAVTVLTSIDQGILNNEIGIPGTVPYRVVNWTRLSRYAGLDGVVASPREVKDIREACGPDFMIVTPGVRPAGAAAGDQKRVMTPAEAIKAGATHLVIGRPITAAPDPEKAAENILDEIVTAMG